MIDKVQKIKEWISKEQDGLMDTQGNFEYPSDEGAFHILSTLDYYIDSLQEEPVSEDLEEEIDNYVKMNGYDGLDSIEEVKYIANHFAKWQKEQMISKMEQFLYEELNNGDIECSDMKFLILYFKKYMEE